jgi:IS4 transposase
MSNQKGGSPMARGHGIALRQQLTSLLPAARIRARARDMGVVVRRRRVDMVAFVWTLVLGFGGGSERTIAGLRRAFGRATGVRLVPSAFYDRFTPALVRLLKTLVADVLDQIVPPTRGLREEFAAFREVLAIDSTVIRLHDLLARAFAGCRTNHTKAAAKFHVVMNVVGRGLRSVKLTGERVHDGPVLRAGPWVRDRLLLFDLGYYRFQLFDRIAAEGGYFLTRLKDGANPRITAVHATWRGRAVPLVGEPLQDVLRRLRRHVLDVEVEVTFRRRAYQGTRRGARARFRLVGVRDPQTGRYHLYLTNVPVATLAAERVAALYAARWTIELLFREWKQSYRLDDLPSSKRPVVESLLYASILTLAASRALHRALAKRMKERAHRLPEERWAIVFAEVARDLLRVLVGPRARRRALAREIEAFLRHEAVDPNAGRRLLLQRVTSGGPLWREAA